MQRFSVVITNYNYEPFVASAIDSALALDWDDVEVVVVDDGSTDGSRAVIESYGDRVRTLFTENASQRVAANRGFALSTGDVVVFLDSDDVLPPEMAQRVDAVMAPGVSKVQFQMQRIDDRGRALGEPFPVFDPAPDPSQIRYWMETTTAYPTPPGSGNAYSRWFLERIFPLDERIGAAADSACLSAAPLLGDVMTVVGTTVGYRRHGGNVSNMMRQPGKFARAVERGRARWRFAQRSRGVPEEQIDETALHRSRELLQFRISAWRTSGETVLSGDSPVQMARDALAAAFQPGPERARQRAMVVAWSLALLLAPRRTVPRLLDERWNRVH